MEAYGEQWAADYDRMAEAAIPGRAGLYRLCVAAFAGLPAATRILVFGSGAGPVVVALAAALPEATFVALEPADAMRAVCAQRVAGAGLAARIALHGTPLHGFDRGERFDAASAVLVSHHLVEDVAAASFFAQLRAALHDGGRLFTADMHIARGQDRDAMIALWRAQAAAAGIAPEMLDGMRARFGRDVCVRDEAGILALLAGAGFGGEIEPYWAVLYGAGTARGLPTPA